MSDLIEYISWPGEQQSYHRIKMSNSALLFEVRCAGSAIFELSNERHHSETAVAIIFAGNNIYIDYFGKRVENSSPNTLSLQEYRRFWLRWNAGFIRLGKEDDQMPLIKLKIVRPFVHTFIRLRGNDHPVYWKVLVNFSIKSPRLKPMANGQLRWVRYTAGEEWPIDALQAGYEEEPMYIMRAVHEGSLIPGKYHLFEDTGYITWNRQQIEKTTVEILCGVDAVWVPTFQSSIPPGALVAGHIASQPPERLYIGRMKHGRYLIPGKVQCSRNACFVSYKGIEKIRWSYEILTVPQEKSWPTLQPLPTASSSQEMPQVTE